ncbi:MAG: hypothetical protein OJJ21_16515 [Ferrovibrio sp.]|uniref:BTAD domain-containing putative transcriptional regulator n=1 Tax=Ferrovibrio sp. TaxID=1917215 RepID=UPI00260A64BA|nr:BTAD domain-containing putative transcriptional regulator [Ferrovibrio sp.]MCW0235206.1 hypothetical protein [Ferrovibrio sp.]
MSIFAVQDDETAGRQSTDPSGPDSPRPDASHTVVVARLDLLGPFRVMAAGGAVGDGLGRKAQALLAYLAATPGHRASRERLASLLWGERFDEQARQSLRQTLMALRRSFHDIVPNLLVVERMDVALGTALFVTDLAEFDRAAADADIARLRQAAGLWRGSFLADLDIPSPDYEDWLRGEREAWRLRMVAVLMRLAHLLLEAGEGGEARLTVNRLVELDPLNEAARQLELAVIARFSGAAAALQSYQAFVAMLNRELGVAPAAETRALAERLEQAVGVAATDLDLVPPAVVPAALLAGRKPRWRRVLPVLTVGLAVLAAGIGGWWWQAARETLPTVAAAAIRPSVLSFHIANTGGEDTGSAFREDLKTRIALLPVTSLAADRAVAAYVIETAVQAASGNRQAVNLRLIDSASGQTLWADSLTMPQPADSRIAAEIATKLYAELLVVLQHRRGPPPPVPPALQAGWDATAGSITREKVTQGRRIFQAALDAAPDDTAAQLGLAHYIALDLVNRWSQQREADAILAIDYLERVIHQMPRNSTAYLTLGMVYKARRDYGRALAAWQVELAIDPRDASAHAQVAHVNLLMGNIPEGIERAEMAIRLHPKSRAVDRAYFYAGMGYLLAGDYGQAEQRLASAIAANPVLPDGYAWRVAALAQAGRQAEAEALYADMKRRFPWWNVDHHFTQAVDRSMMERFTSGLGKVLQASR